MTSYWPESCNELYYRHWRTQIQSLLLHPDNHLAALLSMFACMDLALSCKKGYPLDSPKGIERNTASDLLVHFFPPPEFPLSQELANRLINGLKHVAFVRPGIALQDTCRGMARIYEPIRKEGEEIVIAPTAFWQHVETEIDRIFSEKKYPFPQEIRCEDN